MIAPNAGQEGLRKVLGKDAVRKGKWSAHRASKGRLRKCPRRVVQAWNSPVSRDLCPQRRMQLHSRSVPVRARQPSADLQRPL